MEIILEIIIIMLATILVINEVIKHRPVKEKGSECH